MRESLIRLELLGATWALYWQHMTPIDVSSWYMVSPVASNRIESLPEAVDSHPP